MFKKMQTSHTWIKDALATSLVHKNSDELSVVSKILLSITQPAFNNLLEIICIYSVQQEALKFTLASIATTVSLSGKN